MQDAGGIFLEITEGLDSDQLTESQWKVENVGGDVSSEGVDEKKVDPLHILQKSLKEVQEYKERLVVQLEEREAKLSSMSEELDREKKKVRDLWRINCEHITQYDMECGLKDAELAALKEELRVMRETRDSSETILQCWSLCLCRL